jgi:hypothetical protein
VGCQDAADLPIAGCPWAITRNQGRAHDCGFFKVPTNYTKKFLQGF